MVQYQHQLKIPKNRIAVMIGVKGEVKKKIEDNCKVKLSIDSKEGDVIITGEDSIMMYTTKEIIKAIARGFNPDIALLLLKQDYSLEIINIGDYCTINQMTRIKGRIIGERGKSRHNLESMTNCHISVEGKTVAIIGRVEDVTLCRGAIEKLLRGSEHSSTYRWIERRKSSREEI